LSRWFVRSRRQAQQNAGFAMDLVDRQEVAAIEVDRVRRYRIDLVRRVCALSHPVSRTAA
jgi:hypothetical protein